MNWIASQGRRLAHLIEPYAVNGDLAGTVHEHRMATDSSIEARSGSKLGAVTKVIVSVLGALNRDAAIQQCDFGAQIDIPGPRQAMLLVILLPVIVGDA